MDNTVELLAPAGDLMKLRYALAYGADAVYAGVPRFSLRARENDFDNESLEEAVNIVRNLNKKIYLTLNIFPHNRKIDSFVKALQWMESLGPDAIIVSDPGMIHLSQQHCPSIPIHLSTQANTVNWASVKFWYNQGVRRIILSRELSIDEITEIREHVPEIELESFIHGAICVAYSGRCLLSNYFTHRDPNQGTCTHSCRWDYKVYGEGDFTDAVPYEALKGNYFIEEKDRPGQLLPIDEDENGTYIMNSRDLCAIRLLAQLKKSGVDSFKIEGRNKSVYYVSTVTRSYRKAIDNIENGLPFDINLEKELFAVANRGYITGFLEKNPRQFGENVEVSHSGNQTHQFAGIVKSVDKEQNRAIVAVRNRFKRGDTMEAFSPTDMEEFIIEEIVSEKGESLSVAHGGGEDVIINVPKSCDEYTLLRKPIK
jgi:putative protease